MWKKGGEGSLGQNAPRPPGVKGRQEASRSAPRGLKRPPRALQEVPKGPQDTPRVGQEDSKPVQELPRASQDAHKAFPKHLARQPFSEKAKDSNHGSKKHRRRLRSPISMNPKRPCHKSQNEKRRAGGGDAPWGKSISRICFT